LVDLLGICHPEKPRSRGKDRGIDPPESNANEPRDCPTQENMIDRQRQRLATTPVLARQAGDNG